MRFFTLAFILEHHDIKLEETGNRDANGEEIKMIKLEDLSSVPGLEFSEEGSF
jgi:hypothetical protein